MLNSIAKLKSRTLAEIRVIRAETLKKVWDTIKFRLNHLKMVDGRQMKEVKTFKTLHAKESFCEREFNRTVAVQQKKQNLFKIFVKHFLHFLAA